MTIGKAIKIIDAVIENKQSKKSGLLDPNMSWNKDKSKASEFAKGLTNVMQTDIEWLQAIKKQLNSEISPNCKHPKKLLDKDPDGKFYCMGCNQDL